MSRLAPAWPFLWLPLQVEENPKYQGLALHTSHCLPSSLRACFMEPRLKHAGPQACYLPCCHRLEALNNF